MVRSVTVPLQVHMCNCPFARLAVDIVNFMKNASFRPANVAFPWLVSVALANAFSCDQNVDMNVLLVAHCSVFCPQPPFFFNRQMPNSPVCQSVCRGTAGQGWRACLSARDFLLRLRSPSHRVLLDGLDSQSSPKSKEGHTQSNTFNIITFPCFISRERTKHPWDIWQHFLSSENRTSYRSFGNVNNTKRIREHLFI